MSGICDRSPIEEACDEAFAGKMMGDGYLVRPEEGMAYAPEDATVSFIFPSKHAVGLTSDDGTEYLLHRLFVDITGRIVAVVFLLQGHADLAGSHLLGGLGFLLWVSSSTCRFRSRSRAVFLPRRARMASRWAMSCSAARRSGR